MRRNIRDEKISWKGPPASGRLLPGLGNANREIGAPKATYHTARGCCNFYSERGLRGKLRYPMVER
jgi:hypothetical protein